MLGRQIGLPSWWTGPWRILEDCPATGHNVFRRIERPVDGIKCCCPRALALRDENLRMKREGERKRPARPSIMPTLRPIPLGKARAYAAPDWTGAACRNKIGIELSDRAYNAVADTALARRARARMRQVCGSCPIMDACRNWALTEEKPAGSWGGVWGGLDPRQRQQFARRSKSSSAGAGAIDGA